MIHILKIHINQTNVDDPHLHIPSRWGEGNLTIVKNKKDKSGQVHSEGAVFYGNGKKRGGGGGGGGGEEWPLDSNNK